MFMQKNIAVHIILGSKTDIPIAEKCKKILDDFGVSSEIRIASAHRTPEYLKNIIKTSRAKIFIAIAGLSAALAGVIASQTTRPVIGIPISGKVNLDSILSTVQMPPGIPVAAVGLDNGENAALLAIAILALQNESLSKKLEEYRIKLQKRIEEDDKSILRE